MKLGGGFPGTPNLSSIAWRATEDGGAADWPGACSALAWEWDVGVVSRHPEGVQLISPGPATAWEWDVGVVSKHPEGVQLISPGPALAWEWDVGVVSKHPEGVQLISPG